MEENYVNWIFNKGKDETKRVDLMKLIANSKRKRQLSEALSSNQLAITTNLLLAFKLFPCPLTQ